MPSSAAADKVGPLLAGRRNLAVKFLPIDKLLPYAKNARTHSPAQVAQIAASMREFGWTNPVLVDEDCVLIAGHGRVAAARQLDLTDDIPCIVLPGLTKTQKQALVLADNKLALNAGWDNDLLTQELGELHEEGFDLNTVGFSAEEMDALLHGMAPAAGEDVGPGSAPLFPVTEPGDLWICGQHRLLCGDPTNPEHVDRVVDKQKAEFVFTSPPQGTDGWDDLMAGVFGILPVKPTAQILVRLGLVYQDLEWVPYWTDWVESMRANEWRRFGWYVWDPSRVAKGEFHGRLRPSFEFILHFNRDVARPNKRAAARQSATDGRKSPHSIIRVPAEAHEFADATLCPVDLASEMLETFSDPDDLVYEPFCGQGTSLIGCHRHGRRCAAIEASPCLVDVAVQRLERFTGQAAKLDGDGRTFDQMSVSRKT